MFRFAPLASGSGGNVTFLEAGETRLLVDAGKSCKLVCALLEQIDVDPKTLSGILITHEHGDHISGVDVLSRKFDLPVYANEKCWFAMREKLSGVAPKNRRVFVSDEDFYIGALRIFPFSTYHDAAHPVGFTFSHAGSKCAVCTDIGHIDERILAALSGCRLVLLESNHDVDLLMSGSYSRDLKRRVLGGHGHLCNEDCGRALVRLYGSGVRGAILGHLSQENNYPPLAMATVREILAAAGIDHEMQLALAERDEPTGVFEIA
ncbi:MAG: MBL fold metallo-hydrolase [Clostridiales bacterium]|nr:MBL fold metallo-hydrolase [Clostridiales bacterium]